MPKAKEVKPLLEQTSLAKRVLLDFSRDFLGFSRDFLGFSRDFLGFSRELAMGQKPNPTGEVDGSILPFTKRVF